MAIILRMPEVLANATEAVISKWLVEEGAPFAAGDVLAEVETDKAVVEISAEVDGVLGRQLARAGDPTLVGAPIAVLIVSGESNSDIDALLTEKSVSGERVFASPLARRLARERGVDPRSLEGSGPGGRIVRRDIESASIVASEGQVVISTGSYSSIAHTPMRRAIARRLTESKSTIPHFYLTAVCRVDELLGLRKSWNEWATSKVSVNDLILKTVAGAFQDVPDANVIWTPDELRQFEDVDVSMAVATPNGLVTPVVRGVNRLQLPELSFITTDLATRARAGRLRQGEIEGGTFSVTNLGMYGTQEFSAILNPPQSAILAVGAARQEAIVAAGTITVASVIHFTLSVDHRAIDGALAARWLAAFAKRIESPFWILL
jgi:pyruvate dehydrogenase E2 component (dihydrolipoamide acetyltransferase)